MKKILSVILTLSVIAFGIGTIGINSIDKEIEKEHIIQLPLGEDRTLEVKLENGEEYRVILYMKIPFIKWETTENIDVDDCLVDHKNTKISCKELRKQIEYRMILRSTDKGVPVQTIQEQDRVFNNYYMVWNENKGIGWQELEFVYPDSGAVLVDYSLKYTDEKWTEFQSELRFKKTGNSINQLYKTRNYFNNLGLLGLLTFVIALLFGLVLFLKVKYGKNV